MPNGQRKSKSAKTQKEARNRLIAQGSKAREGLYITEDQLRPGDFLDRNIEDVAAYALRPATLDKLSDCQNPYQTRAVKHQTQCIASRSGSGFLYTEVKRGIVQANGTVHPIGLAQIPKSSA